jgi:hypothetical protein
MTGVAILVLCLVIDHFADKFLEAYKERTEVLKTQCKPRI